MANHSKQTSALKTIIIILLIIIGCSLGLYFIMKYDKNTVSSNNSQLDNSYSKHEKINTQNSINLEYIEDTDVFTPRSAFGWSKPVITNYSWNYGMYYEAFGNVDGISAYNKYKEDLLSKGYKFIKEEKMGQTTMYTYSKNELSVIFGVKQNTFEITLTKETE